MVKITGENNKLSNNDSTQKQIGALWTVLGLLVSIFLAILGWRLTASAKQDDKINSINDTYTDIQVRLANIETNILWIKNSLK